MAVFEVEGPDGGVYEVEAPDERSALAVFDQPQEQGPSYGERVGANYMALPSLGETLGEKAGGAVGLPGVGTAVGAGLGHAASVLALPFNLAGEAARPLGEAAAPYTTIPAVQGLNALRPERLPFRPEDMPYLGGEVPSLVPQVSPERMPPVEQGIQKLTGEAAAQAAGLKGGGLFYRGLGAAARAGGRALLPTPIELPPKPVAPVPARVDVPPVQDVLQEMRGALQKEWADKIAPRLGWPEAKLGRTQGGAGVMRAVPQGSKAIRDLNNQQFDLAHALGDQAARPEVLARLAQEVPAEAAAIMERLPQIMPEAKITGAVEEVLTQASQAAESPVLKVLQDTGFSPDYIARLTPIGPVGAPPVRGYAQLGGVTGAMEAPQLTFSGWHDLLKRISVAGGSPLAGEADRALARGLAARIRAGLDEAVFGTEAHAPWREALDFYGQKYLPFQEHAAKLAQGTPEAAFAHLQRLSRAGDATALENIFQWLGPEAKRDFTSALLSEMIHKSGGQVEKLAGAFRGVPTSVREVLYGDNAALIQEFAHDLEPMLGPAAKSVNKAARAAKEEANILYRQQRLEYQGERADYTALQAQAKAGEGKGRRLGRVLGFVLGHAFHVPYGVRHAGAEVLGSAMARPPVLKASPEALTRLLTHPNAPAAFAAGPDSPAWGTLLGAVAAEMERYAPAEAAAGGPAPLLFPSGRP